MEKITVPSAALSIRAEKPLTPAMISTLWEIAAVLDEQRIPASVPNAVWLTIPTKRLRGPDARADNVWLRQCLERITGLQVAGQHKNQEWGAVMVAEWRIVEGGAVAEILVPPAGVHSLRSPGNFAKIETTAAHRLPPHARRLYALLADRKRQRDPYAQWSLANLRGLMGVDNKRSYEVWAQFRKRVLNPAIDAINDYGTVSVEMTPQKVGRSVAAVRFDWKWKDPHEAAETVTENERHSKARRKVQDDTDAPPMIEDQEQPEPALTWWHRLTDAERDNWADHVGRTFKAGGRTYPRRDADIARAAYEEISADA